MQASWWVPSGDRNSDRGRCEAAKVFESRSAPATHSGRILFSPGSQIDGHQPVLGWQRGLVQEFAQGDRTLDLKIERIEAVGAPVSFASQELQQSGIVPRVQIAGRVFERLVKARSVSPRDARIPQPPSELVVLAAPAPVVVRETVGRLEMLAPQDQHGTEESWIGKTAAVLARPSRQMHWMVGDAVLARIVHRQRVHVVQGEYVRVVPMQMKTRVQQLAAVEWRAGGLLDHDQAERQLVLQELLDVQGELAKMLQSVAVRHQDDQVVRRCRSCGGFRPRLRRTGWIGRRTAASGRRDLRRTLGPNDFVQRGVQQALPDFGIVRSQLQCQLETLGRFAESSLGAQRLPQVLVRLAQIRLALDRAAVAGDGGIGLAHQTQGVAEAVVKDARVRAECNGAAQMLDALLDAAGLAGQRAQQVPAVGMVRIALKNTAIGRFGFLQTTGPVVRQPRVQLLGNRRHERPRGSRFDSARIGLVANPWSSSKINGMVDDDAREIKEILSAAG
jgi:hypothetical protein